jgi:hypothetical protein
MKVICTAEDSHRQATIRLHLREAFTIAVVLKELERTHPNWLRYERIEGRIGHKNFLLRKELN